MASAAPDINPPQIHFRPGKKRKVYRHRSRDADDNSPPETAVESAIAAPATVPNSIAETEKLHQQEADEAGLSVAEVIRRRHARRARLGGVAFRAESAPRGETEDSDARQALLPHGEEESSLENPVGGFQRRFASQTGLVGELVNKHMEEYIESELARRERYENKHAPASDASAHSENSSMPDSAGLDPLAVPDRPAMRGKLLEIDLGEEARERNVAMTERARRRLQGELVLEDEADGLSKKVRVGRDGKPMRARTTRAGEDTKRDQMVEEFMRENKLDVYAMPSGKIPGSVEAVDTEGPADDKIAEKFRREFMAAIAERRQRRRPAINAPKVHKVAKAPKDEILRGPKLGGSRNIRAAMRDILLKEQQEKKR